MSEITGAVNPGIQRTVALLRAHGFETTDSGDGQTHDFTCDQPMPYVHIQVVPASALIARADDLLRLITKYGVSFADSPFSPDGEIIGPHLEAHYSPADGLATISLFNVDDAALLRNDPREYVMGECGDGSMALCCGWCSCVAPDHLPWCEEQAAVQRRESAGGE